MRLAPMLPLATAEPMTAFTAALIAILAGAGVVALIAQRLRLPTIPAYLFTGILLGPSALDLVGAAESIHDSSASAVNDIADLAVVLLMFGIGLHLDLTTLRKGLGPMLVAAGASILLCIALLWPLAMLLGVNPAGALIIAMAGSLSSTAIVLRLLQERRELHRQHGRMCLAILLVQDIAVVPILVAVPMLAHFVHKAAPDAAYVAPDPMRLLTHAGIAALAITGIILLGRYALPRIMDLAASCGNRSMEVLTIISLAFAFGAAGCTQLLGLSPALGAFLGGFLLSATPFRHALAGQIGTLRDVFLAVFFTAIGMRIELSAAIQHWPELLIGSTIPLILKTIAIGACAWFVGSTLRTALTAGLALAGGGEFALVIMQLAEDAGAIESAAASIVTTSIIISMLLITPLMALARVITTRWRLAATPPWARRHAGDIDNEHTHPELPPGARCVVVAGYGLVGRAVADRLTATGSRVTVIEMNMQTVQRQRRMGRAFVFGDVSDPAVLESAGLHEADALVLTIPDEQAVARACATVRAMRPDITIVARASYVSRGVIASSLGANAVVIEELVTAEAMERTVDRLIRSKTLGAVPFTPAPSSPASAPRPAPPDTPSPPL